MTTPARLSLAGIGALGLLPVLAGCASSGAATGDPSDTPPADTSTSYTDGQYTALGSYVAPSGQESVEVTLSLEDDVVTFVEVVGSATDRTAQDFQGRFISGIEELVVGVDIDELDVHRVAGSSLTSQGFMNAVDAIKSEAREP